MGNKNLYSKEAIQKLKDIEESIGFAMMATNLKELPLHIVPMSTKKVGDRGSIWFLSSKNSAHNKHLENDPRVQLIYGNSTSVSFLSIYGTVNITTNQKIIDELYVKTDDAWFDGKEDPNLCVIEVIPSDINYWDTKENAFVSLMSLGFAALTGESQDLNEEGKLKI